MLPWQPGMLDRDAGAKWSWCLQPAMGRGGSWALLCLRAKPHPLWCIDTRDIGWEMTLPRLGVQKGT